MPAKIKFTEEETAEICRLYVEDGLSISAIMKIIKRDRRVIERELKSRGIEIDSRAIGRSKRHNKIEDFIGKRFSKLIVIGTAPQNELGRFCALCECDCGEMVSVPLSDLKSGKRKSCGCLLNKYKPEQLIGRVFGKLTVVEVMDKNYYNHLQLLCLCECGIEKEMGLYGLLDGRTVSCGCQGKESLKKAVYHSKKELEEKYPFFSKVEEVMDNPDGYGVLVRCKLCGKWFSPKTGDLTRRISALENPIGMIECNLYCSEDCKNNCPVYKMRFDPFGKDNSNNNTPTQYELSIWSDEVLRKQREEYGYNFCTKCQGVDNLAAHHIDPKKIEPFYALDPDNGIVFCRDCHLNDAHSGECSTGALAYKICKS